MCVVSNICNCVCCCCICCCVFIIAIAVVTVVWLDRCYKLKMKKLDWEKRIELEKFRIENPHKKNTISGDKEETDKNIITNEEDKI